MKKVKKKKKKGRLKTLAFISPGSWDSLYAMCKAKTKKKFKIGRNAIDFICVSQIVKVLTKQLSSIIV